MTKEESDCLGEMFPTFIQTNDFLWPFEKDFSDIKKAYIEEEGDSNGVYVLLKTDRVIKVTLDISKKEIVVDTIMISKIVSAREAINNTRHKLGIKEVEIITVDGGVHKFSSPGILFDAPQCGQFVISNIKNYMDLVRNLI